MGTLLAGVDGAWVAGKGIMVAVDMGDGTLLEIAEIDEKDAGAIAAWLKQLKEQHQIRAIVSDDLACYKQIADELELRHQVCQFHVQRWVGLALRGLAQGLPPAWHFVLPTIRHVLQ